MKYKVKFEKYINFSLMSNYIIFNTLAGCGNGKNSNKNDKGYSGKQKNDNNNESTGGNTSSNNNEQQEQNPEDLNKKNEDEENLKNPKEELIDELEKENLLKIYDSLSNNADIDHSALSRGA